MKSIMFAAAVSAVALSSVSASALTLKPGQWNFYYQQICLVSDGTAYFTTYPYDQNLGWTTTTASPDTIGVVWGEAYTNTYYESIEVSRKSTINWLEQLGSVGLISYSESLPISFIKKKCDPHPGVNSGVHLNTSVTPRK